MSHWVYLQDDAGETLAMEEPHGINGGTYAVGATECELNITYNYATIMWRVLGEGGVRSLEGKRASDTIPVLVAAIGQLGDDTHPDYWRETEGNVKAALEGLLVFARAHPDGVWSVS